MVDGSADPVAVAAAAKVLQRSEGGDSKSGISSAPPGCLNHAAAASAGSTGMVPSACAAAEATGMPVPERLQDAAAAVQLMCAPHGQSRKHEDVAEGLACRQGSAGWDAACNQDDASKCASAHPQAEQQERVRAASAVDCALDTLIGRHRCQAWPLTAQSPQTSKSRCCTVPRGLGVVDDDSDAEHSARLCAPSPLRRALEESPCSRPMQKRLCINSLMAAASPRARQMVGALAERLDAGPEQEAGAWRPQVQVCQLCMPPSSLPAGQATKCVLQCAEQLRCITSEFKRNTLAECIAQSTWEAYMVMCNQCDTVMRWLSFTSTHYSDSFTALVASHACCSL